MAIFIVENSGKVSYGIKRYICKTVEDIPVEVNGEEIAPGSKIYVTDEKKTYMLNTAGQWVEIIEGSGSGSASVLGDLTDVDLTNLEDGQILKYDENTQTWKPGDDASATLLGNLEDVDLTSLQDGQVIKYDSTTEKWLASDIPSDITEVTQAQYDALPSETKNLPIIYQISNKGYFYYKGKQFRASRELTQAEFDALPTSVKNNGTEYLITDAATSIGDIDDVSISNATDGQILAYNGTTDTWVNVENSANDKMDKVNPTGSGYFSLNRKANTAIGQYSFAEGYNTRASGQSSHAEGEDTFASLLYSHAEGHNTTAAGQSSHAEGENTYASGVGSHAEGSNTSTTVKYAHAEGEHTLASGYSSHAEGMNTTASGGYSHAEGYGTTASFTNSHAEGIETTASGHSAHAEGACTTASGFNSHSEGNHTIAASNNQHVSGKYNISDANHTYAEIIGNGTADDARSNARTLDWQGNEVLAGDLTINGNQSVTQALNGIPTNLNGLSDVNISNIQDGQILKYNYTNHEWINANEEGGGGNASYTDLPDILKAGKTSITITDNSITTDSTIDFYTDVFGVNPIGAVVGTGQITLTFEERSSDLGVKVRVWNNGVV